MKKVLEIRIFEYHYDSVDEMNQHVKWMESQGFDCKLKIEEPILKARFEKSYE